MRRCLKISFLLLFSALLLVVPNMLTAQELDDDFEIDTIEKVEKHPFRVRFMVGGGPSWYSVTTKNDYQQTRLPDGELWSALWRNHEYYNTHLYNEEQLSGFRIVDVRPEYQFEFSLGLAFEKQVGPKLDVQVVPTLVLAEMSVAYETEFIGTEGQVIDDFEIFSKDVGASYVRLPIMIKYRPFVKPLFFIGGISPMVELERKPEKQSNAYLQPNRFDLSADFGMGYQFKKLLSIQITMRLGLIDVIKGREEYQWFYYQPLESARTNRLGIALVF